MVRTSKPEEYYNQLLDILLDELNVKQVRLCNGKDENDNEISLVYDGEWYWIHGNERKKVKNRDNIINACEDFFSKNYGNNS